MILGIDTSNYTTSIAAIDLQDETIFEHSRLLLPVRDGERGLRQSDALFFHVRQLPEVMSELSRRLQMRQIQPEFVRVAVSVRPRPLASSYMPVFVAGESFAMSFALAVGIPVTRTTHQEGHLAAAEHFVSMGGAPFVAVHISGGTSDVMIARSTNHGYAIQQVGEGLDLHAGQFVDRVGVQMGLPFPAGPHLEKLASLADDDDFRLPTSVRGARMSFSGPMTAAIRALELGWNKATVARAVEQCIARSVVKAVEFAIQTSVVPISDVLIVGGVAANETVRKTIIKRLERRLPLAQICLAPPAFSRDNALGVARIGRTRDRRKKAD